MTGWVLAGTTFLASGVEFVEAATIVLAVGSAVAWRTALGGALAAVAVLIALVALAGPALANAGSLRIIELAAGPFLILFGIGWLRKATWRFAGLKAQHDETAIYARELDRLAQQRDERRGFAVAFQGVLVEGIEVAVIVVTFAASRSGALVWSVLGAVAALIVVVLAAVALRAPLARVPENAMKALVGVMLLSIGTFWTGEAIGVQWWAGDATLAILVGMVAVLAALVTVALRTVKVRA